MFNACAVTLATSLHAFTPAHAAAAFAQQSAAVDAGARIGLTGSPDVTNGTHIVDVGLLQMEVGGIWNRSGGGQRDVGTPTSFRLGLTEWLEARISGDGFLAVTNAAGTARGLGNVQTRRETPAVGRTRRRAGPVNSPDRQPAGRKRKQGPGSGQADFTIAVLTGTDFLTHGHIDVNYGIGRIGAGSGLPRFTQRLVSWSASAEVPGPVTPYLEGSGIRGRIPMAGLSPLWIPARFT